MHPTLAQYVFDFVDADNSPMHSFNSSSTLSTKKEFKMTSTSTSRIIKSPGGTIRSQIVDVERSQSPSMVNTFHNCLRYWSLSQNEIVSTYLDNHASYNNWIDPFIH